MERNGVMKKVNIKLYIKSFEQFKYFLQRILTIFSDNASHLEINLVMNSLDDCEIEKILNYISSCHIFKEISNDTIYTFIVTVNPSHKLPKLFTKIRRLLCRINLINIGDFYKVAGVVESFQKKKLPLSLIIKDNDLKGIIDRYKEFSPLGIPIFIENDICYDDEFLSLFEEWIFDRSGYRINIFADILSKVLLDSWGTICKYKSCLTKYFAVDENGNIYSCCSQNNEICNLRDVFTLIDLFSHEKFILLLKGSITKRSHCKDSCNFYGVCQGGCPMDATISIENCKSKQLFMIMEDITVKIKDIINNHNYSDLNPAVRELILSSVASNKLFEKGLFDEN